MKGLSGIAAALAVLAATAAGAADRLTSDGVSLGARTFEAGAPLEAVIDTGGDEVLSVHTLMRPASTNILMMRDRDGFWTEWDGNRDNLVASAARQEGDVLVYKIFHIPPSDVGAMTVTVAYETPNGLKFGWFEAAKAREGTN